MPTAFAKHHQIHGVQPVLPVADVAAAADWFVRTLGFDIDFLHGTPPVHGRVRAGDWSWGAPVFIHLSRATAPIQPCGEIRLHVGHDIGGLHAAALDAGANVLMPPADQPWGLRETTLQTPDGHRLVLCAETAPQPAAAQPRPVIACYRPKPGQADTLRDLVRSHVPRLRHLGLATERASLTMRAADGTLVEAFEWSSAAAIEAAHKHPEVHKMWAEFGNACEQVKLCDLAEAQHMFAEFTLLDT